MNLHYEKVILDINNIIQENTDPIEIINYVSAILDPNIISKTEEEVLDRNSKFNFYVDSFGTLITNPKK